LRERDGIVAEAHLLDHEAAEHQRRHHQEQDDAVEEVDGNARRGLRGTDADQDDRDRQRGEAVLH
jgi:hypothetical protein